MTKATTKTTPSTKISKLLGALRTGKEMTAKEIKTKFGLANPYNAVKSLRDRRNAVYSNQRTLRDGSVVTKYRIGNPTQQMLSMGFTK